MYSRDQVLQELCGLRAAVGDHLNWQHAADCVCRPRLNFQDDGVVLKFIEDAVFAAIEKDKITEVIMDPDANIAATADALHEGDIAYALQLRQDLADWLAKGGFAPDWTTDDAQYVAKVLDPCAKYKPSGNYGA